MARRGFVSEFPTVIVHGDLKVKMIVCILLIFCPLALLGWFEILDLNEIQGNSICKQQVYYAWNLDEIMLACLLRCARPLRDMIRLE